MHPRLVPQPQVCARGSGVVPMCCCALSRAPHTFPPMLCHCLTCLQAELYSKTQKNALQWWLWVSLCCGSGKWEGRRGQLPQGGARDTAEGGDRQQLLADRMFSVLNLHTEPAAWLGHAVLLLTVELFIP